MKIGIISDTHDHHSNVIKAIRIFNERRVKYVLHAGDIIRLLRQRRLRI